MDRTLETIARLRLEEEFGSHANEVLNAGYPPPYALQLRLQEAVPSTSSRDRGGWRPEYGDPESYLQAVYNAQQQ